MITPQLKNQVNDLISQNRIGEALSAIEENDLNVASFKNRLNRLKGQERNRTHSADYYERKYNQLIVDIQSFLQETESFPSENQVLQSNGPSLKFTRVTTILGLTLAIVAIFVSLMIPEIRVWIGLDRHKDKVVEASQDKNNLESDNLGDKVSSSLKENPVIQSKLSDDPKNESPHSRAETNPKATENTDVSQPKTPKVFTSNNKVDISVLTSGDKSHKDFGLITVRWLKDQNFTTTSQLFSSKYKSTYTRAVSQGEVSTLRSIQAQSHTNCICLIDQSTRLVEEEVAGEAIITGILNANIHFMNVKNSSTESFQSEVRGAGITVSRVMESLSDKFISELSNSGISFSQCH